MCVILDCLYLLISSSPRKFCTFSKYLAAWLCFLSHKVFYKFLLKSFRVLIKKPNQNFVTLQRHIACHPISKLLKASMWDWAWIYCNIYSIFSRYINWCTTFGFESTLCIIHMCTSYPPTWVTLQWNVSVSVSHHSVNLK